MPRSTQQKSGSAARSAVEPLASGPLLALLAKYPLPSFLQGKCKPSLYYKWLKNKADTLLKRDKNRGKPYALTATIAVYKGKIHDAVTIAGERDPFTGETLAWELIDTWDTSHDQPDGYKRRFALMPTVDHVTADVLQFEICSLKINDAKCDLTPAEFVDLCRQVVTYHGPRHARRGPAPRARIPG